MKIKTSELTGPALDWAVAKAEGIADKPVKLGSGRSIARFVYVCRREERCTLDKAEHIFDFSSGGYYAPAHSWAQGGPIIERERIQWEWIDDICQARTDDLRKWPDPLKPHLISLFYMSGPTPLIAAMRCYCSAKLGDEIDIPEELCQQQNN